jgi:hypothetical protein
MQSASAYDCGVALEIPVTLNLDEQNFTVFSTNYIILKIIHT